MTSAVLALYKRNQALDTYNRARQAAGLDVDATQTNSLTTSTVLLILVPVVGVIAGTTTAFLLASRRNEQRESEARAAVDVAIAEFSDPFDLKSLMEINRAQMQEYDAQARGQSNTSHWSSLGAMVVGLIIVAAGLILSVVAGDAAAKFSAAIIAAVGTATGGYIAKTFIALNSSVQEQVRYYFEQPLVASYLITAERFIAQMPEADRPEQYRLLVRAVLQQAAAVPGHKHSVPSSSSKRKAPTARRSRQNVANS
ncbi:hypothetical protein ABZ894_08505 [Nocardia beijingensis]|uniref:hypothetical protein n=1 Tax=Nocardia beijingensis TaxID=95162 RepID=UPI0033CC0A28